MAVDGVSAHIIDMFTSDYHSNIMNEIPGILKNAKNDYVLALMNDSHATENDECLNLFTSCGVPPERILCIKAKGKIAAFYQAKLCLDEKNIATFELFSFENSPEYWKYACEVMLTSCYNYSFQFMKQKETAPLLSKNITYTIDSEIQEVLRSQSGHGSVRILKSHIIPDELFLHGFSCRTGGISTVPGMMSLNLGLSNAKRDPAVIILENRRRLADAAGFDARKFCLASAVHGSDVHIIGDPEPEGGYDAIVTNKQNVIIAAPGADCVTVLFADPVARACAALHSGWKGTIKRACVVVLNTMKEKFGTNVENVLVALGPSIGSCCFEFDKDQTEQFGSIIADSVVTRPEHPKPFINLHLVIRRLLEQSGVKPSNIDDVSVTKCTSCNPDMFFSFRRDGRPFGNQVGFIGIR